MHNLTSDRHRRNYRRPVELTGQKEICHAVESLQTIRQKIRQGEDDDIFEDTTLCQIFLHLEESHQIFNCLATADYLYAAILADKNFCRTRAAVVS